MAAGTSDPSGRWPGVTFALDMAPGLPTVTADPTYVEQVLRNLLSNAAKYSGAGSTVEVSLEDGDGEVIVRVRDDGPGLDAEDVDRLFGLYYRAARQASIAPGAGIGLFVCRELVTAMGGRIWATPRPDKGAEFGFSIPVYVEEFEDVGTGSHDGASNGHVTVPLGAFAPTVAATNGAAAAKPPAASTAAASTSAAQPEKAAPAL